MSNSSNAILSGALAGAVSGVAIGLIDGLWSFGVIDQYLPGFLGKLGLLLHLSLSYALAMGLGGAALGLLGFTLSKTAAPGILSALRRGNSGAFAASLPLAIAAPPITALASVGAYLVASQNLVARKHPGLVTAVSMGLALLALAGAVIVTLLAGALVDRAIGKRLARSPESWGKPLLVGAAISLASAAIVYVVFRGGISARPIAQMWLALPAALSPLAICAGLPVVLARIDGERIRELALPLVASALPLVAIALAAAFKLAIRSAGGAPALVIAQAMSLAVIATSLAFVLSVFLARLLERPLRKLASPSAPALAAMLMIGIAGATLACLWWKTLALLPLRPFIVGTLLLAASHVLKSPFSAVANRVPVWAGLLAIPLTFGGVVLSGSPESVQKAQRMHAGLSEPLARVYRRIGDWDRDGSSRWLGGGDCDDSNPDVHPRADEIPFDGIDNNCLRGDVTERSAEATHFAAVPANLPADFNVLLLTIDTIRADHLGAYGYERDTTPNLDALAADGTLFRNAWAHAPSTRYSIPALLTGRHPLNVRYRDIPGQWPGLDEANTTIAEIMQERGMRTGAILNYWYFDAHRKMNQGFDDYDNTNRRLHKAVRGKGPAKTSGSSSREQSDKAIAYMGKHASERFFLWVHYYDPHYDYEKHPGTPEFGSRDIDAYDHEIAYTDKHIGRVIDDLKAKGLYEKTVIVVTGDHGEGFGEHGIDLHGYHLYAAQTKVPFLVRVPGTAPSVLSMPASHVDILPTLANLAGAPSSTEMLGRSLLGVVTGEEDQAQERYVFQQLSYENNNEYRGAISSKCHVLYNVSPSRSWELYRVDIDPMETRDIINTPGECAGAREALETWYDYSEIPEGAIEALLSSVPEIETPISVKFGKAISLLQIRLPKTLRRGQAASMELTWNAGARPPKGWKVFAHFEKAPGQPSKHGRFTSDHKPPRPFSWWSKGQYIRYGQPVTCARSQSLGRYNLWFGIYRGNERMPVRAEGFEVVDNRVNLATIEVVK
ncbi:MAG: sulfatase-like hydrolase/transferase [Myxococcales bacterium]|nr:sulfatase-like hydrolase/transferase [Myxococcales bacterium]